MSDAERLARILKVLAAEARLCIVKSLKRQPACVTELTSQLGISQEATSQHLKVLKDAGIVTFQKHGPYVYYHLHRENVVRICKAVNLFLRPDSD